MKLENNIISIEKNHWYGFDFIKGLLIILVFMGHIIPGVLRETFPRYVIYSFHMPLFIGISGFLLNIRKMIELSFIKLLQKYWRRMILPWIIAVLFFFLVTNLNSYSLGRLVLAFISPYYHLWYVLGILSYVMISCLLYKAFSKLKFGWFFIFAITILISVFSKWDILNRFFLDGTMTKMLYDLFQYDFRIYNLIFFVLGIYLRNCYEEKKFVITMLQKKILRIALSSSIIVNIVLFFFGFSNIENIVFYVMNSLLLVLIIIECIHEKLPRNRILEFIGQYSLPIYLYHILSKIFSLYVFGKSAEFYVISCFVCFSVECFFVYILRKVKWINRVIFGSTNSFLS